MKHLVLIFFISLGSLTAVSAPVRSLVAARNTINDSSEKVQYTAADYIQDGLIVMWDGIENAGWGVHDNNATVWKNLLGDTGYDFPNCASWLDNCFNLTASYIGVLNSTEPKKRIITSKDFSCPQTLTAEVVYSSYLQYPQNTVIFGNVSDPTLKGWACKGNRASPR